MLMHGHSVGLHKLIRLPLFIVISGLQQQNGSECPWVTHRPPDRPNTVFFAITGVVSVYLAAPAQTDRLPGNALCLLGNCN